MMRYGCSSTSRIALSSYSGTMAPKWGNCPSCSERRVMRSTIALLNAEYIAALNQMYALFGNAGDPQRIGNIQIGKSLYGLGRQKTGEVVTAPREPARHR